MLETASWRVPRRRWSLLHFQHPQFVTFSLYLLFIHCNELSAHYTAVSCPSFLTFSPCHVQKLIITLLASRAFFVAQVHSSEHNYRIKINVNLSNFGNETFLGLWTRVKHIEPTRWIVKSRVASRFINRFREIYTQTIDRLRNHVRGMKRSTNLSGSNGYF